MDEKEYLSFEIEEQKYALGIDRVREIINSGNDIIPVAGADKSTLGIIHLRDEVIPVLDLRERFGLSPFKERPTVILVEYEDGAIGFAADRVSSVESASPELIRKAPAIINPKGYIAGVAKCCGQIVFILDPDALREDFKVK
ncbi:MAG: chemotaxis protein CheW [Oscillospiraceae bacterium]|nr:chemotaxis protein CheW [Oscillospiraceae bacterium]